MSFNVRLFGYNGTVKMHIQNAHQLTTDSVFVSNEPSLWESGPLASNGATPVAFTNTAIPANQTGDKTNCICVEVPDTAAIRYECNPPNRSVAASTNSRKLTGTTFLVFGSGWQFQFIDAASAP